MNSSKALVVIDESYISEMATINLKIKRRGEVVCSMTCYS